ncbi:MAG: LytR C-terminal domain-containing protein, partial [Desulfobacterales bacterium]
QPPAADMSQENHTDSPEKIDVASSESAPPSKIAETEPDTIDSSTASEPSTESAGIPTDIDSPSDEIDREAVASASRDASFISESEKEEASTPTRAIPESADSEATRRSIIEVSNGNGVRRMANKVGYYLNKNGFQLMYLTNAEHFNHSETMIYYLPGFLPEAKMAARKLPVSAKLQEVPELDWKIAEIRIMIGKDLVPHLAVFEKKVLTAYAH